MDTFLFLFFCYNAWTPFNKELESFQKKEKKKELELISTGLPPSLPY